MQKFTISRDDHAYACFPDIARLPDGALVVVYRESMTHGPWPFSRLVTRRSIDEGMTWSERQIVAESLSAPEDEAEWPAFEPDARRGWEDTRARITEDWQHATALNCARLLCLADGSLLLIADQMVVEPPRDAGPPHRWQNWIWRSLDGGLTWTGPERPALPEGNVPQILQLRDGRLLLGLNEDLQPGEPSKPFICTSSDDGHTWSEPVRLPVDEARGIDETGYVELDDGTLIGFGRNFHAERAGVSTAALKVISNDGGQTWRGPFDTRLQGCEGRAKAGLLRSGEVCLTYRCCMPNEMLALHVMTQEGAVLEELGARVPRQPIPGEDTSPDRPPWLTGYYPGRTMILDHDRNVHLDGGYSGWVQLPSGDLYVVDYLNDDARLAQIRGYQVARPDLILFPPGDMPHVHPGGGQAYRTISEAWAERQVQINRSRQPREASQE